MDLLNNYEMLLSGDLQNFQVDNKPLSVSNIGDFSIDKITTTINPKKIEIPQTIEDFINPVRENPRQKNLTLSPNLSVLDFSSSKLAFENILTQDFIPTTFRNQQEDTKINNLLPQETLIPQSPISNNINPGISPQGQEPIRNEINNITNNFNSSADNRVEEKNFFLQSRSNDPGEKLLLSTTQNNFQKFVEDQSKIITNFENLTPFETTKIENKTLGTNLQTNSTNVSDILLDNKSFLANSISNMNTSESFVSNNLDNKIENMNYLTDLVQKTNPISNILSERFIKQSNLVSNTNLLSPEILNFNQELKNNTSNLFENQTMNSFIQSENFIRNLYGSDIPGTPSRNLIDSTDMNLVNPQNLAANLPSLNSFEISGLNIAKPEEDRNTKLTTNLQSSLNTINTREIQTNRVENLPTAILQANPVTQSQELIRETISPPITQVVPGSNETKITPTSQTSIPSTNINPKTPQQAMMSVPTESLSGGSDMSNQMLGGLSAQIAQLTSVVREISSKLSYLDEDTNLSFK